MTAASMAQPEVGALYGRVTDTQGVPLPGVSVSLDGLGATKTQVSDERGQFRFLGLDPGEWALAARLDGFSTVEYPDIDIRIAANTTVEIEMPGVIEEVILVTGESPLLDERKIAQGTLLRQIDLETIPTARDPWSQLTQAPTVLVDRINVGGSESGQASRFRVPASDTYENDYLLDGVQITDMALPGTTSTYYDFDQFTQIELSTGGSEITKNTPGVSLNLVTKRGTNEFRGSARFLLTDDNGYFSLLEEAEPGFSESDLGPGQTGFVGDTADRIEDYGFEAGGPLWRDRVWLWGSWATNDISIRTGGGDPDRTVLENTAVKVNAQLSAANSFVGSFNNGEKRNSGRGGGPNVDPSATYNQRGPTGITRLEDTHVFGSNLVLSGQYSFVDGGFAIQAQGGAGPDQPPIPDPGGERNVDAEGYQRNNLRGSVSSPATEWKLDGSWFFNTGTLSHEVKFGGRLREAETAYSTSYPGRNILHYAGNIVGVQTPGLLAAFGLPPERYLDANMVYAYRQGPAPTVGNYDSAWVQDTFTTGRWTVNAGLRYDRQSGENEPATVDANLGFPEVMPALSFPGDDAGGLEWTSLSPRLGATHALGAERRTLLRASLSRFPSVLGILDLERTSPLGGQWAAILFLDDPGGYPGFYDEGEPWVVLGGFGGFDPADPTALESSDRNDPGMDPPVVSEALLGVEHSFRPELIAGLSLTWRRKDDTYDLQNLFTDLETGEIRTASAEEYLTDRLVSGTLPDGSPLDRLAGGDPERHQEAHAAVDAARLSQLPLPGGVERPRELLRPQRPQPHVSVVVGRLECRRRDLRGRRAAVDLAVEPERDVPGGSRPALGLQCRRQPLRPGGLPDPLFPAGRWPGRHRPGNPGGRRGHPVSLPGHLHRRSAAGEGVSHHRQFQLDVQCRRLQRLQQRRGAAAGGQPSRRQRQLGAGDGVAAHLAPRRAPELAVGRLRAPSSTPPTALCTCPGDSEMAHPERFELPTYGFAIGIRPISSNT
jgi:hypothetical protein